MLLWRMAFVKLDTGILRSTLWDDRDGRDVFITALLMAEPFELIEPTPTFEVRTHTLSDFVIPPGWYGRVEAAGVGIVRMSLAEMDAGMAALERLSKPELESRSQDFEGRRLVRIDGGYIILNFMKYRDRDYTTAVRSQRYRERKKQKALEASHRDSVPPRRDITQAEAELEAETDTKEKAFPAQNAEEAWQGVLALIPDWHARTWNAERHAALPIGVQRGLSRVGGFAAICQTAEPDRVWLERKFVKAFNTA